jgi:hypothetical protein
MLGFNNSLCSDRCNIVVIAYEAHRSQYDFIDGFSPVRSRGIHKLPQLETGVVRNLSNTLG